MDVLLTTLLSVIDTHHDLITGAAEPHDLQEVKKRFYQALHDLIDFRIKVAFEQRRAHQSQEMIAVADTVNASIKSTASTIRSIAALNSAPPPPTTKDPEAMDKWVKAYQSWYEGKRKAGVTIE